MYLDEAVISIQKVLPITTLDHETTELFQHGASKLLGRPREKFGVLRESGGVVTTADTRLGLHRSTLHAIIRKFGIARNDL
jgi:transcriptional regulator of acetoin/glycerol metabolism